MVTTNAPVEVLDLEVFRENDFSLQTSFDSADLLAGVVVVELWSNNAYYANVPHVIGNAGKQISWTTTVAQHRAVKNAMLYIKRNGKYEYGFPIAITLKPQAGQSLAKTVVAPGSIKIVVTTYSDEATQAAADLAADKANEAKEYRDEILGFFQGVNALDLKVDRNTQALRDTAAKVIATDSLAYDTISTTYGGGGGTGSGVGQNGFTVQLGSNPKFAAIAANRDGVGGFMFQEFYQSDLTGLKPGDTVTIASDLRETVSNAIHADKMKFTLTANGLPIALSVAAITSPVTNVLRFSFQFTAQQANTLYQLRWTIDTGNTAVTSTFQIQWIMLGFYYDYVQQKQLNNELLKSKQRAQSFQDFLTIAPKWTLSPFNNVDDDTTAFQEALNAAISDNGIFEVRTGVGRLTSLITIAGGVRIIGKGSKTELNGQYTGDMFQSVTSDAIAFERLIITRKNSLAQTALRFMPGQISSGCSFTNVTFNGVVNGVNANYVKGLSFNNTKFVGVQRPLVIGDVDPSSVSDVLLQRVEFENCYDIGAQGANIRAYSLNNFRMIDVYAYSTNTYSSGRILYATLSSSLVSRMALIKQLRTQGFVLQAIRIDVSGSAELTDLDIMECNLREDSVTPVTLVPTSGSIPIWIKGSALGKIKAVKLHDITAYNKQAAIIADYVDILTMQQLTLIGAQAETPQALAVTNSRYSPLGLRYESQVLADTFTGSTLVPFS